MGCGGQNEAASGQTFENEDGRFKVGTSDLDLPEGWPDDVPFPSDTKILMSMNMGGTGHKVSYSTKETLPDLVEWYQDEMAAEGWPVNEVPDTGKYRVLVYEKEGRKVTITLTDTAGNVTSVAVTTYEAS